MGNNESDQPSDDYGEDVDNLPDDNPEKKKFQRLMAWLNKAGAETSKVQLRFYNNNYRGLHARSDIKKGEVIICVPRKQLITLAMAWKTPIGEKVNELGLVERLKSIKHLLLAMFCIQEEKPKE